MVLEKAFYVDEFLKEAVIKPIKNLSFALNKYIDETLIQGSVLFLIRQLLFLRKNFAVWQSGNLQSFLLFFALGLGVLLTLLFIG